MTGSGFLAVWSDIARVDEADYLRWLTREHIAERMGVPGFISARVFRARIVQPRYLILYSLKDHSILSSEAYLERLNSPSAWTRRIMPILSNFKRGGGTVRFHDGWGNGGIIAPLVDPQFVSQEMMTSLTAAYLVAAVSLLESDDAATNIVTTEKSLRSQDATFNRLLVVEATSEETIAESFESIRLSLDQAQNQIFYELAFHAR